MPMPFVPYQLNYLPAHNRLPEFGTFTWWPMHGTLNAGVLGMPDGAPVGSGHLGSPWEFGFYVLPTANATAGIGFAHEDDNFLDLVWTLANRQPGSCYYVVQEVSYIDQATSAGYFWSYGTATSVSFYGLSVTTAEALVFNSRGRNGTANLTTNLTLASGTGMPAVINQGRFVMVTEIRMVTASTCDIKVVVGRAGAIQGTYTASGVNLLNDSSTDPPGRHSATTANHFGLTVGCRSNSTGVFGTFLGNGPGNIAKLGVLTSKWENSYVAGRAEAVLASAMNTLLDIPRTFLRS